MEGYSAQNIMGGALEGDPNYILYSILSDAAKSLGITVCSSSLRAMKNSKMSEAE